MRFWKHFLFMVALAAISPHLIGQQNTVIQPDCLIPFTFTAAGNFPVTPIANGAGDNRTKGCAAWTLMYQSTGLTGVSVTFQSGSSVSTTVSFGAFAGTISTGFVNPIMSDTGGSLQATNKTADVSWVRINVAATGSGTLTGVLYGFRNSSAAVNSITPSTCPVGSLGAIQLYLTSAACAGDGAALYGNLTALSTPSAPTVTATCTVAGGVTCGTTWCYALAAVSLIGPTTIGPSACTAAGPNTRSMTNYATIGPVPACAAGQVNFFVYAINVGGDTSTAGQGFLAPVACSGSLNDTGLTLYSDSPYPSGGGFKPGTPVDESAGLFEIATLHAASRLFVGPTAMLPFANSSRLPMMIMDGSGIHQADTGANFLVDISGYTGSSTTASNFIFSVYQPLNTTKRVNPVGEIAMNATVPDSSHSSFRNIAFIDLEEPGSSGLLLSLCKDSFVFGGAFCLAGTPDTDYGFFFSPSVTGPGSIAFVQSATDTLTSTAIRGLLSDFTTEEWKITVGGVATFANAILASDVVNPFINTKNTQTATAPGAAKADIRWLAGTNAGTCKLVANAGTSATEVTIIDNVGGGC
jgi:hypothetical protein